MSRNMLTRETPREKYYRPVNPLRPKAYWIHRPRRAWYQSIFAYLVPLALLALIVAIYYTV